MPLEPVDNLGQCVVVAVALAAHRRLNAGFCQTLAVSYRYVLRPPVAVMDQGVSFRLTRIQGLFQGVEYEVGPHRAADAPANDTAGEDVDDEGHVHEACQVETYVKSLTHSWFAAEL